MSPVFFRSCVAGLKQWSLLAAVVVTLAGCASALPPEIKRLPDRVELNNVPFFRGNAYQSGPGALASLLSYQRVQITPGLLDKPLQLPGGEGRLEQSLPQVARQYGFMVYPLDKGLASLLTQVSAGFPVMLRFAEGTVFTEPRYAVLVGYNRNKQTVLLHAGMNRHLSMSFSSFSSAWEQAGSWAVLIQNPRQLPAHLDEQRWIKAASELAQAGQEQAAGEALKTLKAR
ncbi:putative lipoprotein [Paucimonas lemoignei]|jgi:hypothetical protein|nr:putative lipoprotein [Paucimonas lemoignei]